MEGTTIDYFLDSGGIGGDLRACRIKRSPEFAIPSGLLFPPPSLNVSERDGTVANDVLDTNDKSPRPRKQANRCLNAKPVSTAM